VFDFEVELEYVGCGVYGLFDGEWVGVCVLYEVGGDVVGYVCVYGLVGLLSGFDVYYWFEEFVGDDDCLVSVFGDVVVGGYYYDYGFVDVVYFVFG